MSEKGFLSIKGIYYQAEIAGQPVTWVVPHSFSQDMPADVDFRVMLTFVEFYTTLLGFVNFKIYNMVNLHYPPQLAKSASEATLDGDKLYCQESELEEEGLAALSQSLLTIPKEVGDEPSVDEFSVEAGTEEAEQAKKFKEEEASLERLANLFAKCKIFLSREIPRENFVFMIRSFGGDVSWPSSVALGATFDGKDETITHQVVDRPVQGHRFLSRYYIQPQWIVDSVNYKRLQPVEDYFPGVDLPPHLSPFVVEKEGDYIPPERQAMLDEMEQEKAKTKEEALVKDAGEETDKPTMTREERNLAKMVMPKKDKRLLEKIEYSKRKKMAQTKKLQEKRKAHDEKKVTKKIKTK